MPRPLRIHVPAAFYHVTLRGNHLQDIFFSPDDRSLLNTIVAEVLDRFGARMHAYCWMTNHVHLLIQVGDVPLGRLMLRIASRYACKLHLRTSSGGHLFQRRVHAVLVDAEEYLLELLRYIHLNPVRAQMVVTVDDYVWSSHHAYLGTRIEPWVTTDFALAMFHREHATAINGYRQFVDCVVSHSTSSPLQHSNPNDPRILGSDTFAAKLLGDAWRPRSQKTVDELITEACQRFSVTHQLLLSKNCQRQLTQARAWVARQALTLRISSLSQIARLFNRTESSLREGVKHHFHYP